LNVLKRHKAFTLAEITVVLAISAVVFILAIFIYGNIKSYFEHLKKQNAVYTDISALKNMIEIQTFESDYIVKNENALLFKKYDHSQTELKLEDDYLLFCRNEKTDTIFLKVINVETKRISDKSDILEFFNLTVQYSPKDTLTLTFFKEYDSKTYYELLSN